MECDFAGAEHCYKMPRFLPWMKPQPMLTAQLMHSFSRH